MTLSEAYTPSLIQLSFSVDVVVVGGGGGEGIVLYFESFKEGSWDRADLHTDILVMYQKHTIP